MTNIHNQASRISLTAAQYWRTLGLTAAPPQTMLLLMQNTLYPLPRWWWTRNRTLRGLPAQVQTLHSTGHRVGVATRFGFGAPATAALVELLAAWGVRQFWLLGMAGGLQPHLAVGDVLLPTHAVRGEGTSRHYGATSPTMAPYGALQSRLGQALTAAHIPHHTAPVWTTDAPFRETTAAIDQHTAAGVAAVEMETAALWAVAHHLQLEIAVTLLISDGVAHGRWQPATPTQTAALPRVAQAVIAAALPLLAAH